MITVEASKHPLRPEWVSAEVDSGQSIYEIVGGAPVAAYINGREVPAELHRLTTPKDGSTLVIWPIPQGDDLGTVLGIVVAAAAIAVTGGALAPVLGSSFAAGTFGAYAAGVAVSFAGSLAVNALIPPQSPTVPDGSTESFNRLESITGTSNRVAAFQPIPRLYGTMRYFPAIPMTARPFTEVLGSDQYFRMLLCLGYGPLEIGGKRVGPGYPAIDETTVLNGTPIRIGETDIAQFDDVEFEIGTPDQMTLYSDQVIETNPAFTTGFKEASELNADPSSVQLNGFSISFSNYLKEEDLSAVRTTEPNADEISIQISGQLFSVNDNAKTRGGAVSFKIEYREIGQSDWIVENSQFKVQSSKKETVRAGYRWRVPTGQYEVRLTRFLTEHQANTAISNNLTWNALRTIRSVRAFDEDETIVMSLRIKATDQLNGRIEDLSVLATSVLKVWDGQRWVDRATSNPAWAYADIWSGTANRRPIERERLDTKALTDWARFCDDEGFRYNGVFDSEGTTLDRAAEVAGAGLATWAFNPDGTISVVRDVEQSVPRMVISPRNSSDFSFEISAVEVPDALRVRFIDPVTYENTERLVFDSGFNEYTARTYETLEAKGVTNGDQAWKFGRFHLAQQRLRPERFTFKQDVQHLRYRRGDLLTLQHDVILVGLDAGRVKSVTTNASGEATAIELDELIQFIELGKSYGVKIQRQDGSIAIVGAKPVYDDPPTLDQQSYGAITDSVTETDSYGSITDAVTSADDFGGLFSVVAGSPTLSLDTPVEGVDEDDLVIFGEAGRESIDVKVSTIEPEGNLSARVTCVPAAAGILESFSGSIPAYDPVLTQPTDPSQAPPKQPVIASIRSDEQALLVDTDGSLRVRMLVELSIEAFPGWDQKNQVRYRAIGDNSWTTLEPQSANEISILDVDTGVDYEVQARGVKNSRISAWTPSTTHQVVGKSTPPPDVAILNAVQNGESVVFRWAPVIVPDIAGYEIRYGRRGKATWNDAIRLAETTKANVVTEADVPPGNWTFFVKAIDTAGNFSVQAARRNLRVVTAYEDVIRVQHDPNWDDGVYVGFEPNGTALQASNEDEAFYATEVYDLGFDAKNVRVWADLDVGQSNIEDVEDFGRITDAVSETESYGAITESVTETGDYGLLQTSLPISDPVVTYEIATRNAGEQWPNEAMPQSYGRITEAVTESVNHGSITESADEREIYDMLMTFQEWTRGEVDARYIKHRARISRREGESGLKLLRGFETVSDVNERTERQKGKTVEVGGSTFTFSDRFHFLPVVVGAPQSSGDLYAIRKDLSKTSVTFVVRDSSGTDVGSDNFDFIATGV